jgi:hypothetical protein
MKKDVELETVLKNVYSKPYLKEAFEDIFNEAVRKRRSDRPMSLFFFGNKAKNKRVKEDG